MRTKTDTIGETLYWCYANLAMSHAALEEGATRFERRHYIIRTRLYAGLRTGAMTIGPLADDERLKLTLPQACAYCGGRHRLSVDHLIPRKIGGEDIGENMVWACRTCNSSKGARDALVWLKSRGTFPPLLLLRRYLKLAVGHCSVYELLSVPIAEAPEDLPFTLAALPRPFASPKEMVLWTVPIDESVSQ
jgi:hypothetical protein